MARSPIQAGRGAAPVSVSHLGGHDEKAGLADDVLAGRLHGGAKGELDWHVTDDDFAQYVAEMPKRIDTMIFGRVTYEMDGEVPPAPLTDRTYSGIFKVRVPALVHRNLVIEAAEAGVSLNRLVSAKLAHG
jgi:dihydrofolate reductase